MSWAWARSICTRRRRTSSSTSAEGFAARGAVRAGRGRRVSLWVAPVALIGVVAVAVVGRGGSEVAPARVAASAARVEIARASVPVAAVATPSHRSDWPAAIGRPGASVPPVQRLTHRSREEGTDGLMGSLPFGIPGDTPYPPGEMVNRFTIDDVVELGAGEPLSPGFVRPFGLGPFSTPAAS